MKVLAVETSTEIGGIALAEDEVLLGEITLYLQGKFSEGLVGALKWLLEATSVQLDEIEGIAVGLGPGSFTGLRVGLAFAKGLAFSLKKPLVGVPSMDAMAFGIEKKGLICCLLDAKKGELYVALFKDGKPLGPVALLKPKEVLELLKGEKEVLLLGNALNRFKEFLELPQVQTLPFKVYPRPEAVAFLGMKKLKKGEKDDLYSLSPLYIRSSEP